MLQGEHSAIFLNFIKLPFVIKIFDLSVFEWPFYTDFTVYGRRVQTKLQVIGILTSISMINIISEN